MMRKFIVPPVPVPQNQTTFSLHTVARALHIVAQCDIVAVSNSYLHVRVNTPREASFFKLRITRRLTHACVASFAVTCSDVVLHSCTSMLVDVTTADCATGLLAGLFYRRAAMLLPLPPYNVPVLASTDSFVTRMWSPVRLARLATILYVHTYNSRYDAVQCDPTSMCSVSLRCQCPSPVKLTMDYKPTGIAIVTNHNERFLPYSSNVTLSVTDTTFQWVGVKNNTELAQLCRLLWQQLTVLL